MNVSLVSLNKDEAKFAEHHGRIHCVVKVENAEGKDVLLHFYRSAGLNAKTINGVEYTADEIRGKWFLVFGLTSSWINKIETDVPQFVKRISDMLPDMYRDERRVGHGAVKMTSGMMVGINKIHKYPPVDFPASLSDYPSQDDFAEAKRKCTGTVHANYHAKMEELLAVYCYL